LIHSTIPSQFTEENKNARTTPASPAFARQKDATVGIDRSASISIPELPGFSGAAKFREAACQVSADREKFRTDCALCIPTAIVTVEAPNMDNTKTPEVLSVIPLPTAQERRRREIMLARVMLVAIDTTLSGEGMGLETARDLIREVEHAYPELVDELL
jgi:hypothetical protein